MLNCKGWITICFTRMCGIYLFQWIQRGKPYSKKNTSQWVSHHFNLITFEGLHKCFIVFGVSICLYLAYNSSRLVADCMYMVIKYIFLVFLQVDLHKIAKSMNFYHDINSGTFLNIRSHRVDGSSPNHTYIVRIYVNPHNIILIMYAYLCASSLNYTYIVRILVCIHTKS